MEEISMTGPVITISAVMALYMAVKEKFPRKCRK